MNKRGVLSKKVWLNKRKSNMNHRFKFWIFLNQPPPPVYIYIYQDIPTNNQSRECIASITTHIVASLRFRAELITYSN